MGRLPTMWAGMMIKSRWPYEMAAELSLTDGQLGVQYPDASFQNGVDKPFEIHRLIPRVYALDSGGELLEDQPDQGLLAGLVRARITDLGNEQLITKTPTLLDVLTKGSSERTWEWAEPLYIIRSQQLQVTLDALAFPAGFAGSVTTIKIALCFQGYLCIVEPPLGNR